MHDEEVSQANLYLLMMLLVMKFDLEKLNAGLLSTASESFLMCYLRMIISLICRP